MVKRDGRWHEVSWDEALDAAAEGLARHRGRFGALASAKATNEDGYLVQKFCRVVMGTNDVDHCTRLCHSPSVEAMLASMASGARRTRTRTIKKRAASWWSARMPPRTIP